MRLHMRMKILLNLFIFCDDWSIMGLFLSKYIIKYIEKVVANLSTTFLSLCFLLFLSFSLHGCNIDVDRMEVLSNIYLGSVKFISISYFLIFTLYFLPFTYFSGFVVNFLIFGSLAEMCAGIKMGYMLTMKLLIICVLSV